MCVYIILSKQSTSLSAWLTVRLSASHDHHNNNNYYIHQRCCVCVFFSRSHKLIHQQKNKQISQIFSYINLLYPRAYKFKSHVFVNKYCLTRAYFFLEFWRIQRYVLDINLMFVHPIPRASSSIQYE